MALTLMEGREEKGRILESQREIFYSNESPKVASADPVGNVGARIPLQGCSSYLLLSDINPQIYLRTPMDQKSGHD